MEKSLLKNVAINFTGLILPVFVSLVTVPAYIHGMGVDRYGVINLVWALIGYFSVLDLGISTATENHIAKARHSTDGTIQRIFWSAFFLNVATGLIGAALIWVGAYVYIEHIAAIEPVFQHEVLKALPWIAIAVPVANMSWVFSGAINGMEKFTLFNVNQTIGTFLFQLLPLAALYLISPSLAVVVPAAVIARLAAALLLGYGTCRAIGIKRVSKPEWPLINELFRYGRWLLLYTGASAISTSLDRVVIGSMLGARYVAYYATPQNLITRLDLLPTAMLRTLFPRLSAAASDHADEIAHQALAFLNCVLTPCVVITLFALTPFLNIWLGHEMAHQSAPVGRILVTGVWLVGQSRIISLLIQAKANPAHVALVGWVGLPIFALALWLGIRWYGMLGVGMAVVAKSFFDYVGFLYFSKLKPQPIVRNMAGHLVFLVIATICSDSMDSLPRMAAIGLLLIVGNLIWSFWDSSELRDVAARICRRFLPGMS
ncbi:O-antigen/teichoic acid export membrane protein [Paraburkholderia sp. EB58]|jgi:O-antigen/teichoic acid export membrane protein|uniref:flippase n=1 Tax=Paraburkholderia sp. EB58 TaxID=3035125 RepID=UPI003D1E820C